MVSCVSRGLARSKRERARRDSEGGIPRRRRRFCRRRTTSTASGNDNAASRFELLRAGILLRSPLRWSRPCQRRSLIAEEERFETQNRSQFGNDDDVGFLFSFAAAARPPSSLLLLPPPACLLTAFSLSSFSLSLPLPLSNPPTPKITPKRTGLQGLGLWLAQDQDRADADDQEGAGARRGRQQAGQPLRREEGQGRGRVRAVLGGGRPFCSSLRFVRAAARRRCSPCC